MSIAFIADVHVGNFQRFGGPDRAGVNQRARDVLAALSRAVGLAQNCEALVILGDLFHVATPTPALLAAVQEILSEHPNVIALVGNHDQTSNEYGNNALAPLSRIVHVVERPTRLYLDTGELWLVPFQSGPAADWLPVELEKLSAGRKTSNNLAALGLHLGIKDQGTPYYLDYTQGSVGYKPLGKLSRKFGLTHVFAGDWHRHQTWKASKVELMQVGALAPNRFPPNYEHGDRGPMAIWHGDRTEVIDVPGPRFFKVAWNDKAPKKVNQLLTADRKKSELGLFTSYLKLRARTDKADDAREFLRGRADLAGWEVDVDRGIERAKARTASFEARRASSLDDALAYFVKAMPLDKDLSRDEVLSLCRSFLG